MTRGFLSDPSFHETSTGCYQLDEQIRQKSDGRKKKRKPKVDETLNPIIGIDGEGITTPDGRHLYIYIAAVDEDGKVWGERYNPEGLSHAECMEVLLELPKHHLIFGYMISYDMTKILEELPDELKYTLMRPDERKRRTCKTCHHSWTINLNKCPNCDCTDLMEHSMAIYHEGRQYQFAQACYSFSDQLDRKTRKWGRSVKIWDCFRFFAMAFISALKAWDCGTKEEQESIAAMKEQRGEFAHVGIEKICEYCKKECHLLAKMMRKVIQSHVDVELDLNGQYQGAGATASAMLRKYEVDTFKTPKFEELHPHLIMAVLSSFFGGRFENSTVGMIEKPVHGFDIASAYPYAETFHPCLQCGKWEHVSGRGLLRKIEKSRLACVFFEVCSVDDRTRENTAFMPLPFRDEKGSICYPFGFCGWAWKPEILSALAGWGDFIHIREAWIYNTDCVHEPFAFIPEVYSNRIRWGKEGRGLVLKLGANATYGKTAQNVGRKPFNDWIWAGNTTAHTRAQINRVLAMHSDRWNALSIATDGIYTCEKVDCPLPKDTGTAGLHGPDGKPKMPLGGWEYKSIPTGVFIAKPGLYWSLGDELNAGDVRARGVGRKAIFEQRQKLIDGFLSWDRQDFEYSVDIIGQRFFGIKQSLMARSSCEECDKSFPGLPRELCPICHRIGTEFSITHVTKNDAPAYGKFFTQPTHVGFDPHPKRMRTLQSAVGSRSSRMFVRDVGGTRSRMYKAGITTPEGRDARQQQEIELEQPDWNEELGT
jgi:hypothetical protein